MKIEPIWKLGLTESRFPSVYSFLLCTIGVVALTNVGRSAVLTQSYVIDEVIQVDGFPVSGDVLAYTGSFEGLADAVPFTPFTAALADYTALEFRFEAPEGQFFQWTPSTSASAGTLLDSEFAFNDLEGAASVGGATTTVIFENLVGEPIFTPTITTTFAANGSAFELSQDLNLFEESTPSTFSSIIVSIDYSALPERTGWTDEILFEPQADSILEVVSFDLFSSPIDRELSIIPEPSVLGLIPGSIILFWATGRRNIHRSKRVQS